MKPAVPGLGPLRIALFATAAAIVYGILHDMVTAHLCVEYFTIGHPPVFATTSPFLLALGLGVIATWWVGLPLGWGLAAAARMGSAPKLALRDLKRPVVTLMVVAGVAALISGSLAAWLIMHGHATMPSRWAAVIPSSKHAAFFADAWAHTASYGVGALGGLFVIGHTIRRRYRAAAKAQTAC